ncbi:hypothetical protein ACH5A7_18475 [Streptomyces sp. NPDC018955]|uniref:hypothetical protein n=1 Tax=Streptomyces sp. NPDC018955 TaxID=3365055 RepID=UPI003789EB8F
MAIHAHVGCHEKVTWNPRLGRRRRIARQRAERIRRRRRDNRLSAAGPTDTGRVRWAELLAASLPGLAALLALLFTWIQVTQAGKELAISERGQITSRFNAAVSNLGAASADVRLGGIYALEQIMRDSAPDQPAVVSVLSAYARHNAPVRVEDARKAPVLPGDEPRPLSADLQAVMTVLGNRRPDRDRGVQIDLSRTALPGLELSGYPGLFPLRGVDLREADLRPCLRSAVSRC